MTRNSLIVSLLNGKHNNAKLGVIIKGVEFVNPYEVVKQLSLSNPGRHYYVAAIGYGSVKEIEDSCCTIATNIEKAVFWRSRPEFSGNILVFINGESEKLNSLAEFDIITPKTIAHELLDIQAKNSPNEAETKFWDAMKQFSNSVSLTLIEDFIKHIQEHQERESDNCGIAENMWCLNLLRDDKILDSSSKSDYVEARLAKNRELIVQMSFLSDDLRKKMSAALAKTADPEDKRRLRKVYQLLQEYFKFGKKDTLKNLTYDDVCDLITVSKRKDNQSEKPHKPDKPESQDPPVTTIKELKGKELDKEIGDALIDAEEDDVNAWKELLDKIKVNIETDPGSFNDDLVRDNKVVSFKLPKTDLRQLVGKVCNEDAWGAVMITTEAVLKTAIFNEDNELFLFQPAEQNDSLVSYNDASLFELMKRYDKTFKENRLGDPSDTTFEELVTRLSNYRNKLVERIDLILSSPVLYFGFDEEGRTNLLKYVDTWTELYQLFDRRYNLMREIGDITTSHIAQSLLRLDILYVKTPTEYKAILLPLHPVYLWRYYEVTKLLLNRDSISEEEKTSLKEVINSLPQVLNFVVVDKNITDGKAAVLPCSGNIEMLPTYENKTNRYLGANGIECIMEVLSRWSSYAPYSRNEIRICTVDAPDHLSVLHMLADYLDQQNNGRIVYNIYLTKGQNVNKELSQLNYSGGDDSIVGEYIKENKIVLSIKNVESTQGILDNLKESPVHIAFYFDQSSFTVDYGQRQSLYINPLVVTYSYDYDSISHHGRLYPSMESDSGLVGGYHKMLNLSGLTSPTLEPHVNSYSSTDTSNIVASLELGYTQWLIVGDRSTSNYTPSQAIPIGEKQYDKRQVSIWAKKDTRIIRDYEKLLRKYNISPKSDILVDILSKFGHISSTGLVSIPKFGADNKSIENRKKGLIGTLFSASWYTKNHDDSVVVSLDTQNARCWLFSGKEYDNDERADLLGLNYNSNTNTLYVQPLEVKTHDDSIEAQDEKKDKITYIRGHAADQVAKVITILKEIFGLTSQTSLEMFTSARREVLKYQIVSECFRNVHDSEWQKRWEGILKDAFKPAEERKINIEISGILLHVKLSVATGRGSIKCVYEGEYDQCEVEFTRLAAKDIQREIFGDSLTELVSISVAKTKDAIHNIDAVEGQNSGTKEVAETNMEKDVPSDEVEQVESLNQEINTKEQNLAIDEHEDEDSYDEDVNQIVRSFKRACKSFHVNIAECNSGNAVIGPGLVRIRFRLELGQSLNVMKNRLDDIGREMQRTGILVKEISNSNELNLDIPRIHRKKVFYRDVENKITPCTSPEQLFFALGRTPEGRDIILNLAEIPHLLVGGSTGSGKTVFLYSILISLLQSHPKKDDMTLILSSSKMEDFVYFENCPQLYSSRVISDATEATDVIKTFVTAESRRRGELLASSRSRDIIEYNAKNIQKMSPIVVIIDEFADLADQLTSKKEKDDFYTQVQRIAQTGRSRGIHLIVCTQRPEAKLVPPTTKAQLNGRVALRVNDGISSTMIIDCPDARNLQKHGDLLYKNGDVFERAQGYFIDTDELETKLAKL